MTPWEIKLAGTTEPRVLESLPSDPSDEALAREWTLTPEDIVEVRRCRGDGLRHSFALQLCTLRRLGRFLGDDYSAVTVRIVSHIGRQLGLRRGHPFSSSSHPDEKQPTWSTNG